MGFTRPGEAGPPGSIFAAGMGHGTGVSVGVGLGVAVGVGVAVIVSTTISGSLPPPHAIATNDAARANVRTASRTSRPRECGSTAALEWES